MADSCRRPPRLAMAAASSRSALRTDALPLGTRSLPSRRAEARSCVWLWRRHSCGGAWTRWPAHPPPPAARTARRPHHERERGERVEIARE
eukprot:scaffold38353_cov31-Tisochrysis_lutea.AAC.1